MNRPILFIAGLLIIALLGAAGYFLADWQSSSESMSSGTVDAPIYQSGPFRVSVALQPESPVVGENQIVIKVEDAQGNPVSDAKVQAYGEMPAMGAMPAMRAPAALDEKQAGIYSGSMNLEMRGEWPMTLNISKSGLGETRMGFDMATGRPGLQLASGGQIMDQRAGSQVDMTIPHGEPGHADVSHYTCSMHPSVKETGPGSCPICGMDLVPVTQEEVSSGTITVDARRRQMIGIKTAQVTHKDLTKVIRAVGKVDYDERRISNVTLKFDAWIGDLKADYVGTPVKRGQVLFTVYSPELLAAQQEYLETRKRLARRGPDDSLLRAARQRLMLWDISAAQVRQLEKRGKPMEYLPIYAPNSGTVVEKQVVEGSHMKTGSTLLRIADLSKVWVDAEVYEGDLPLIAEGMKASVTLPYLPEEQFEARVDYLYPYLEGKTRTARIRLVLDNPDGRLKPEMYAEVKLQADLGHRLAVPEEAVLVAGDARVVFVDMGEGKLKPTRVKTAHTVEGWTIISEGLRLNDTVVTSGNFLIAAEAKLKTGVDQW